MAESWYCWKIIIRPLEVTREDYASLRNIFCTSLTS